MLRIREISIKYSRILFVNTHEYFLWIFSRHGMMSISRLRGLCYNGASNMQGKFNGLECKRSLKRLNPLFTFIVLLTSFNEYL